MNNVQLITRAIEPIYHSNTRTRFKLNALNTGILPNLRLCNISISDVVGGDVPAYYGKTAGVLGLIKRITLSEKGNPIEDLSMNAAEYMTFLNSIDSQDNATSMRQYTVKARKSIVTEVDLINQIGGLIPIDDTVCAISTITANTSNSARLDLQQYFNFLKSEDMLVGFKDMELVIEWETATAKIFDNSRGGGRPNVWVVDEPLLVFEEILDKQFVAQQALKKRGTTTAFITPELELVQVPDTLLNIPVTTELRLVSAKNKMVHKLLVAVHDATEGASDYSCENLSRAQPSEVWQVYVNNAQLFQSPISSESRKLATLQDSFGTQLASWFDVRALYQNPSNQIKEGNNDIDDLETGTCSYFGCDIRDIVTNLRINYTRTRDNGTGIGGNLLNLSCFMLVQKYLTYAMDGSNIISYSVTPKKM
jgi:hypothetical protein